MQQEPLCAQNQSKQFTIYTLVFVDLSEYPNMSTKSRRTFIVYEADCDSGHVTEPSDHRMVGDEEYNLEIVWPNVLKFIVLHLMAVYSLSYMRCMSLMSWLWLVVTYLFSGAGMTAGAHRLWSHRTYKARLPLRSY